MCTTLARDSSLVSARENTSHVLVRAGLGCRSDRENATLIEQIVRREGTADTYVGTSWAHTWQPWAGTGNCPQPAEGSVGLGAWLQKKAMAENRARREQQAAKKAGGAARVGHGRNT